MTTPTTPLNPQIVIDVPPTSSLPVGPKPGKGKDHKYEKWVGKEWKRTLKGMYIASGVVFAAMFIIELVLYLAGYCGNATDAGVVENQIFGVTTDFTVYDGAGTFAPQLLTPYTLPICVIWMTAFAVAAFASLLMYAMRRRLWFMMTEHMNGAAPWLLFGVYYGLTTMAVTAIAGVSNIFAFVAVAAMATAVSFLNGLVVYLASRPETRAHIAKAAKGQFANGVTAIFYGAWMWAGILCIVLLAMGWSYYGWYIATAASYAASSPYILAVMIVYSIGCVVQGIIVCMSVYHFQRHYKDTANINLRIKATNVWAAFMFVLFTMIAGAAVFIVRWAYLFLN